MVEENINHDKLYKALLTNFFKEFMEGFFPEASRYIDYNYLEFIQQEITNIKSAEKHVVDILVKTKLLGEDSYILIHVEPQAQKQGDFNERMFKYFCNLYFNYNMNILPIAVLAHDIKKEEPDRYSMDFPFHSVVDFRFLQLHLKRYHWRDYLRKDNPVVAALLCRMDYNKEERLQLKKEFFRMILKLELDEARAELLTTFMDAYLSLSSEEEINLQKELEKELPQEEVKKLEELMTSWEKRGLQKGLEQGMEKGMEKGKKEAAVNMAKTMLQEGEDKQKISKYTGLSKKEIEEIEKELS